jgi:putative cell wall-binding protein
MLSKKKILIIAVDVCIILLTSIILTSKASAASSTVKRIYGADRYSTNMNIVSSGWSAADNVVIASGEDYPDALCAAPLAKAKSAPIILTDKDGLSKSQLDQLSTLKVKNAFIIGGTGVITTNVEIQLKALGINYIRFAGSDRYETSAKIAEQLSTDNGVMVASGKNFPDALSVASIAAAKGMPILLSSKDKLPHSIKAYLTNKNIPISYIIGGTGALGSNVETILENPKRLYGADRYKTNINVIKEFESSLNFDNIYIASGNNFPDALSGSVLASNSNAPIALVGSISSADTLNYLKAQNIKNINILGGTGAVTQAVEDVLENTVNYYAVTKINDVFDIAFVNEDYHFPKWALVIYDNNSEKLVNVKWDSNILDTSKEGSFIYTGTVNGYDRKINLSVKVIKETGSINGNLSNGGLISNYKGYIYYSNPNDNNKVYKMALGIAEGTKLSDDVASAINIVNNTIFFINSSDNNSVYSMKLDGSQRTKLTDANVSSTLLVASDTIYYADNHSLNPGMYKMTTNGANKTKLCDGIINNLVMEDGYLYFGNMENSSYKMYTMKLDGSEKTKVNNDNTNRFSIENGWIYYVNESDRSRPYKVKSDGTNRTMIEDVQVKTLNVFEGWIYYNRSSDLKLFKISVDGLYEMKLSDISTSNIFIMGDYVFCRTPNPNQKIYAIKVDGSGERRLAIPSLLDKEPNNDIASSQVYKIMNTAEDAPQIAGSIQGNDIDVYKLNITRSNTINIFFIAPDLGENAVITVIDSKGEEIYSIQTDLSGEASLRLDVTSGIFYLKVSLKNDNATTSAYNMISWLGEWN